MQDAYVHPYTFNSMRCSFKLQGKCYRGGTGWEGAIDWVVHSAASLQRICRSKLGMLTLQQ